MTQKEMPNFIESKAVVFSDPQRSSQYKILMTAFEGEDVDAFQDAGYRGDYVIFNIMDGGVVESFSNPYDSNILSSDETAFEFLMRVREGHRSDGMAGIPWEQLRHSGEYYPIDFPDIFGGL